MPIASFHQCFAESLSCVQLFVDPTDCSLPGSSVRGIPEARILEWTAMPSARGSSRLRDWTWVSRNAGGFFYWLSHQGSPPAGKIKML